MRFSVVIFALAAAVAAMPAVEGPMLIRIDLPGPGDKPTPIPIDPPTPIPTDPMPVPPPRPTQPAPCTGTACPTKKVECTGTACPVEKPKKVECTTTECKVKKERHHRFRFWLNKKTECDAGKCTKEVACKATCRLSCDKETGKCGCRTKCGEPEPKKECTGTSCPTKKPEPKKECTGTSCPTKN